MQKIYLLQLPFPKSNLKETQLWDLASQAQSNPSQLRLTIGQLTARFQAKQSISYLCEVSESDPNKYTVVGRVENRYQYGPMLDLKYDGMVEPDILQTSLKYLKGQIPAPSNTNLIVKGFLKEYNCGIKQIKYGESEELGQPKSKSQELAQFRCFGQQIVPTGPSKQISPSILASQLFQQLKQCFRLRPIWLRNSLLNQLELAGIKFSIHQLCKCLRLLSYSYKDGPWKHTHVRFGYDPQKDHDALVFQSFSINTSNGTEQKKKKELTIYDPTMRTAAQLMRPSYQFCDIVDEQVLHQLRAQRSLEQAGCDKKYGFFQRKVFRRIIRILKNK